MQLDIATANVMGMLLALARTGAWVALSPPFSTRLIPGTIKAAIAIGLALPIAPTLASDVADANIAVLLSQITVQVLAGAALGFATMVVFAAIQAAGDLIDLFGGFSLAAALDPLSLQNNSVFGRLHQLLATTLLFVLDLHLMVIRGFVDSFRTLPLGASPSLAKIAEVLVHDVGVFFLSAVQIAGPLIGVFFLADVGMGLLTRIAPALNAFQLGFPVKILLTLVLVGLTFPLLPGMLTSLIDVILESTGAMARSRTGG
jgi:flagellar biosynthetic protein FliR